MKWKTISRILRRPFNRWGAIRQLKKYHEQPRTIEETVYWAMNFGGSGYYRITTIQKPSEILSLAKAVQEIKPKIILEIGTARGGTLLIWSKLASEEVITCDIEDRSVHSEILQALAPPDSACRITLMKGNSHDPAFKHKIAEQLHDRKVDFLFIDGDHTEVGVTADYYDYKDFVRPGGIIAFHDIMKKQPLATNQVFHLWEKIKHQMHMVEFVDNPNQCGFGIGVLYKR